MGYLDRQSRVFDVILTERGRKLYAAGQLDFAYFGLFDELIDYDPWYSGSLSETEREAMIEATPILEAPFIKDVRGATAPLEPTDHLFTAASDYLTIPHMDAPTDGSELSLMADQRGTGGEFRRTGTNLAQIDLRVVGEAEKGNPGFVIRVFATGSNGMQPLDLRRDLSGRRAVDPFIAVSIDSESPLDSPRVESPDSSRVVDRVDARKR